VKSHLCVYGESVVGRDSSVGIATCYGLDGPGDRIPIEARFSAPVQTGPGVHPPSYTRVPGRGVSQPPPSSFEVKEIIELYLCSLQGLHDLF
jgi:hypothetical protein